MKRAITLLIIIFCQSSFIFGDNISNHEVIECKAPRYYLVICAIFQNDGRYLPEWIEFHKSQGVEKFYLYNNLSIDNYMDYLSTYIKTGLVSVIQWPYEPTSTSEQEWLTIQCGAYMDCIKKIRKKAKWCAFLDTDEFLFCPTGKDLRQFLKKYEDFGGVGANWQMYGTSGVLKVENDQKMTDLLVMRAADSFDFHRHVKSIVQPIHVENCTDPHCFKYKNNKFAVTENKERIDGSVSPVPSVKKIRINHYWSRDFDYLESVKIARRLKWGFPTQAVYDFEKQMNEVFDPMSNYVQ